MCAQDPELRLLYVACFAVGAYPSAERTYKPFNPILGETFELQRGETRYIAEQVQSQRGSRCVHALTTHRPPLARR